MLTTVPHTDRIVFNQKQIDSEIANKIIVKNTEESIVIICFFSGKDCGYSYDQENVCHELEFIFSYEYLQKFDSRIMNFLQLIPSEYSQELCCNSQLILHELINTKFKTPLRAIFIESKALALLLIGINHHNLITDPCHSCKFLSKPLEKEKISRAKEILLDNLKNPPTIPELAMLIGINQCYLKQGFKELFGTTVYEFIQEQRMNKAKLYLTTSEFTISQIADEIGFSSTSNFSSAFKKWTGIFPSQLRKEN